MARHSRSFYESNFFHVMVQGNGKEHVFSEDNWKGYYLQCMKIHKETIPVKILSFCIMSNHAHILLEVSSIEQLSAYLKKVNEDYARYYNRINNRVGHVFRDRFKCECLYSENHLMNCVAYIHNNPLKAGIVENAADYQYSSLTNYLRQTGIVDFSAASKLYGTSPEEMIAIMLSLTNTLTFLEHDKNEHENPQKVLAELQKRFNINSNIELQESDVLRIIISELKARCKLSLREASTLIGIGREKLRRKLSISEEETPPSQK